MREKIYFISPLLLFFTFASGTCLSSNACWPTESIWQSLNASVHGNLVSVNPPAQSCYAGPGYNKNTCKAYQQGFLTDLHRESHIGTMQNINWETCEERGCLLNSLFPSLPQFFGTCSQGALPRYALNSTNEHDIITVMRFAQLYRIAFNIKNSGHDYLGRSTSPDSITVWIHPLQKIVFHDADFQPVGCSSSSSAEEGYTAFTFGGGVKWFDAYRAAHEHNVTVVGGAQAGVGVAGGWLGGGGHSMLTPAFGLGVDHVLQYKVITANGQVRAINRCQSPDLFWALRGGGGGTFGIVTEVTMRVYAKKKNPKVQVQAMKLVILSSSEQKAFLIEFARHSERWAKEGWGGYFYYYGYGVQFVYGNPLLSKEEAEASMKPLLDFVHSKPWWKMYKRRIEAQTFHDFYSVFMEVLHKNSEMVGYGARIASRLVPQSQFRTDASIEALVDAFMEGTQLTRPISFFLPTQILATTSLRVQDLKGETSVQPLFRSTVWHVIYTTGWIQGTPEFMKRKAALGVSKAADLIRKLTPHGGAYLNEADILEPNWTESFWGDANYKRLVEIKQKYDPDNFFNCWKCIGWDETMATTDKKYRCYQY
ncbi:hypothetical protein BD770DRAFT_319845 [Pilaira anomala]|nr:hypothetical protein BD770DRAFT_319845 [Pilaira anomala]